MDAKLQRSLLKVYNRILQKSSNLLLRVDVRKCIRNVKKMGNLFSSRDRHSLLVHMKRQAVMLQSTRLKTKLNEIIRRMEVVTDSSSSSSNESTDSFHETETSDDTAKHHELYKVQRIVGFRLKGENNSRLYLVRWKGYDSDDDTWEPVHQLMEDGCGDLIAQFHKEHIRFH